MLKKSVPKLVLYTVLILISAFAVSALSPGSSCWDNSDSATCQANNCKWQDDAWGTGWCETLDCWGFWTESECGSAEATYNLTGCNWQSSAAISGWCGEIDCWSQSGTSGDSCVNGTLAFGLSCDWQGDEGNFNCMGGPQCTTITASTTCANTSGCSWGSCYEKGCWGYSTAGTCNVDTACVWNSNYNYCEMDSCWSNKYNTSAKCNNVSDTNSCTWNSNYGGYCEELSCYSYNSNQTGCTSPSTNGGLSCEWDTSTNTCNNQGCWSFDSASNCNGKMSNGRNCTWQTSTMGTSGWCERLGCWSFDSYNDPSANVTTCVNNTASVSNCVWDNSTGGGWCYENVTSVGCSSMTDQRGCWDTMYCFWNENSNTCEEPQGGFGGGAIGGTGGGIAFQAPPCGIFYQNQTACTNFGGNCTYNAALSGTAKCSTSVGNSLPSGVNCSMINSSNFCNDVSVLPYCCEWSAGTCSENKFSTSCRDNLKTPPDGAMYCEDTESYGNEAKCNQVANSPWYMPCIWNNQTGKKRCEFASSLFGGDLLDDEKGDLDLIDNKVACEQGGGGTWVTETYCIPTTNTSLNNLSVTAGRCSPKLGTAGGNCNIRCSNCEYGSTGAAHASATAARTACEDSDLGFCEFITDTNAGNGFGLCKPKKEFQNGAVTKCTSTNCDACNSYQSGKAKDKCTEANCQWAVDPSDTTKGTCIGKGEKTCADDCGACKTQEVCAENGKGGSSACTWDTSYGFCKAGSGDSNTNSEICFNGIDDDNDGNIDCADNGCFTDPFCGGNSMLDCFQYNNNNTCLGQTGCYWFNDTYGQWCDMKSALCWQNDGDQATCESAALSDTCQWNVPTFGTGTLCDIDDTVMDGCFSLNSSNCDASANCGWYTDPWCSQPGANCGANSGWCGHIYEKCWNNFTLSSSSTLCDADPICSWMPDPFSAQGGFCEPPCFSLGAACNTNGNCSSISGFCDPIGFGGGGSELSNCWNYDTDQVQCDNQTQCSWMTETQPFCDMGMNFDCMQFGQNSTGCMGNGNCTWINQTAMGGFGNGAWCAPAFEECFMNMSLQGPANSAACNANPNCNYSATWMSCEPSAFTASTQASCATAGGLWRNGWCNPAGMAGMFGAMDMTAPPTPLGRDGCTQSELPAYSDICDAGLKDSMDTIGLGMGVRDVRNASMCNGINTFQGSGTGTETAKYYWYGDTDGSTTGGCTLHNDSTSVGWDLYFSYVSSYSGGSLTETRQAYRCISNTWTVTNIQLSSWKEKMCNELRGAMVAFNKDDLSSIEGLFDLSSNMRFFMSTANASTNSSAPLDTLGPVYYTPGTMDFMPECCWSMGDPNLDCDGDGLSPANDPDCDFMSDGFVKFEDCWGDGIDDDGDGLTDCNDPDCKGNTYCVQNSLGVEAGNYVDTTTPKILYWRAEKFPDSVSLSFDSDEPTNGTLFFYGNVSGCTSANLNATLYDVGVWNTATSAFKNWHEVELYNDGGTNSLSYNLDANETYFYKFEVCDETSNCAKSACSNFTTAQSAALCKKCNFIFNMELPSGWNLDLDLDTDNTYETKLHRQCGTSAGILLNYTQTRSVNLRFNDTANNVYIYFMDVRLTRSIVHERNIRKIDDAGGLKGGTTTTAGGATIGYGGLSKEVSNKLVEKFHPKKCMIRIPSVGTILYHCDDSLENCVDKTSVSTINDTNAILGYTTWEMPCKFSTYAGGLPGTPSSSSSSPSSSGSSGGSSGGGGGGGVGTGSNLVTSASYLWSNVQPNVDLTFNLKSEKIAVSELVFKTNKEITLVSLKVSSFKDTPSGITSLPEEVYQHFEVTPTNLANEDLSSVSFKFTVPMSWVNENNIDKASIVLKRYTDAWTSLATTLLSENGSNLYFSAASPGFSYFAVSGKAVVVEEQSALQSESAPVTQQAAPAPESVTPEDTSEITGLAVADQGQPSKKGLLFFGLIVLLVAGVIFYYVRRRNNVEEEPIKVRKAKPRSKRKK